ncbi:MAG: NAD(P)-binding domain-containing protein, partial [Nitriliruptoraceae bacterium]
SMGATVAASFCDAGHHVMWISHGRSAGTVERAEAAGLTAVDTLAEAVQAVDVAAVMQAIVDAGHPSASSNDEAVRP